MREVTAVQLRQSLGALAKKLERDRTPILLKLGNKPVGVIISMQDFKERFVLQRAEEERLALVNEILGDQAKSAAPVQKALDELRGR